MQAPFGWPTYQNNQNFSLQQPPCAEYIWDVRNSSINGVQWQGPETSAEMLARSSEQTASGQPWKSVVPEAMPWANCLCPPSETTGIVQFTGQPSEPTTVSDYISQGISLSAYGHASYSSCLPSFEPGYEDFKNSVPCNNIASEQYSFQNNSTMSSFEAMSKANTMKRKLPDLPKEQLIKRVRVNEERMSNGLEQLCLNSELNNSVSEDDNKPWCGDFTDVSGDFEDRNLKVVEQQLDNTDLPKLHISKELMHSLRSHQSPLTISCSSKDLVTRLAMEELNKPCMQLVLWKPQSEILINAIDNNDDEKKPATENMDNIDTRLSDVKVTTTATPAFYSELQVQPEIDDWNFDMSENIMNDS